MPEILKYSNEFSHRWTFTADIFASSPLEPLALASLVKNLPYAAEPVVVGGPPVHEFSLTFGREVGWLDTLIPKVTNSLRVSLGVTSITGYTIERMRANEILAAAPSLGRVIDVTDCVLEEECAKIR